MFGVHFLLSPRYMGTEIKVNNDRRGAGSSLSKKKKKFSYEESRFTSAFYYFCLQVGVRRSQLP